MGNLPGPSEGGEKEVAKYIMNDTIPSRPPLFMGRRALQFLK